ncbi:hypothetical protein PMAYCL1PPCAC_22358, partial [Pristionchus mayeri]
YEPMPPISQILRPLRNVIFPKRKNQGQAMHLFDLPHDVLREIMKTMSMKDRMRLRRTCRTFGNVVADTLAIFDHAVITVEEIQVYQTQENTESRKKSFVLVKLGQVWFKVDFSEDSFGHFQRQMNRLSSGISINECRIKLTCDCPHVDFVLRIARLFKICLLTFVVDSGMKLRNVIELFPKLDEYKLGLEIGRYRYSVQHTDLQDLTKLLPLENCVLVGLELSSI